MDRVRLGFVGVGAMGQCAHLRNYVTLPECQLVALAELREELGRQVAARYGVPRAYRTHEEMLATERLDAIVAIQQFDRHGSLLPQLLRAGLPILIEKPLAASLEVGERILTALEASGTWLMVAYHKRSDPATRYVKTEVARLRAAGEAGALRYVRITMPPGTWTQGGFNELIRTDEPYPEIAPDPPAADMDHETYRQYVAFVNYYIHQVNLLRHLLGEGYRVTHADTSGVLLIAESESRVTGVIELAPYQTTVDWQESALVCFERAYLKLHLPAPLAVNRPGRVELLRDPGEDQVPETVVPHLPWIHAMRQQAINFLAAVKGEAPPTCTAQEAMEDLRVAREYVRRWLGH